MSSFLRPYASDNLPATGATTMVHTALKTKKKPLYLLSSAMACWQPSESVWLIVTHGLP